MVDYGGDFGSCEVGGESLAVKIGGRRGFAWLCFGD